MKTCVQCQGRLGLGVRSRNLWTGHWWIHVRFCSTYCEALHKSERYERRPTILSSSVAAISGADSRSR
jgi:hypothetical protein